MKNDEPLSPSGDGDQHEPHFEPIISLPVVKISTMEEEEEVLIKLRAKLFRLDAVEKDWKERGTGEVKLLHHEKKHTVRVVMRRDKTLKLCANHYVTPIMEMKPNCGSDRAWVWKTLADFADGDIHAEVLAIKFINSETAMRWKETFDKSKTLICMKDEESSEDEEDESERSKDASDSDEKEICEDIEKLKIKSEGKNEDDNKDSVKSSENENVEST